MTSCAVCYGSSAQAQSEMYPVDIVLIADGKIVSDCVFFLNVNADEYMRMSTGEGVEVFEQAAALYGERQALDMIMPQFYDELLRVANETYVKPTDAYIDLEASDIDRIKYVADVDGRELDKTGVLQAVFSAVISGKACVYCSFLPVKAALCEAELRRITADSKTYSTFYGYSEQGRKQNVRLAAKAIDKQCVRSGEVFSFNATVGERSVQNGYAESNQIIDGEYVRGIGGGVCQVSSTLFSAALHFGLGIEKRKNHSLAVGYIPKGMDATVSEGTDLCIKNDSGHDIYIFASCDGQNLRVKICGKMRYDGIKISTRVSKIIDFDTKFELSDREGIIKDGTKGCTVVTTVTRDAGGSRVELYSFKSVYLPTDRIIAVLPNDEPEKDEKVGANM